MPEGGGERLLPLLVPEQNFPSVSNQVSSRNIPNKGTRNPVTENTVNVMLDYLVFVESYVNLLLTTKI